MEAKNKRFLVVSIILILSAGLVFWVESTQKKLQIVDESFDFPLVLGQWRGEEIPVSRQTLEILESPFVIIRKYTSLQGEVIYFSGVFSSRNRKAIHPPEVCLTGGGVSAHKDIISLKINDRDYETNRLVITPKELSGNKEVIFYWYKARDKIFTNFYAQQLQITWSLLLRKPLKLTDIALLRVSTPESRGEGEKELEERLKDFVRVLFSYLKI